MNSKICFMLRNLKKFKLVFRTYFFLIDFLCPLLSGEVGPSGYETDKKYVFLTLPKTPGSVCFSLFFSKLHFIPPENIRNFCFSDVFWESQN